MDNSTFVYVTFIRTTPERLWSALTQPDFIQKYWFDMTVGLRLAGRLALAAGVPRWPGRGHR